MSQLNTLRRHLQGPLSIPKCASIVTHTPQSFLLNFTCLYLVLYCKASLARLIRGIFHPEYITGRITTFSVTSLEEFKIGEVPAFAQTDDYAIL